MSNKAFLVQGPPTPATGTDLSAGTPTTYDWDGKRALQVSVGNFSGSPIYVAVDKDDNDTIDQGDCHYCIPDQSTFHFPVAMSQLTLVSASTATYSGSSKNLFIVGYFN